MKNNLFSYATSELSQDAFICYLAAFALDEAECEPALKKCAEDLLHLFVEEIDPCSVVLEQVQRQVEHIDVLLTARCNDTIYKIIVEDKTFTSEHDNQLIRYINDLATTDESVEVRGVYYKTGFQGNLSYVKEANYTIVTRETMLEFLAPYIPHISNQIVLEYYEYWRSFQDDVEKHIILPLQDWDWKQINGCYNHLQRYIFNNHPDYWASYGYVSTPSGGFYGLWTGGDRYCVDIAGIPMELYLQYEISSNNPSAAQLCLKLTRAKDFTGERRDLATARDTVIYDEEWTYRLGDFHFSRPARMRSGSHMTIGLYDSEYKTFGDIVTALDHAIIDYERLIDTLTNRH